MTVTLQLFGMLCGLLLMVVALLAVVKRDITERQSLFWIFSGLFIIVFCLFPGLCVSVANFFGVVYAPSMIFLLALLLILFGLFYCFRKLAKLNRQVRDLAIHCSLYEEQIETLKKQLAESERA